MLINDAHPQPTPSPLVWVVDSAYTGELNARLGVVERLNYAYELIPKPNGDASGYQQMLRQKYARHGNAQALLVVISGTGEETTAEIADLRPHFNGRLLNVYLASILPDEQHPRLGEYDLIASPQLSGDNVVTTIGVAHKLTDSTLASAKTHYAKLFSRFRTPVIGVLIGGNTRYCDGFNVEHARGLATRVANIAAQLSGTLVVTNSRRTPPDALTALLTALDKQPCHFFDWQQTDSLFYPALLAHADVLIVTGDSLSMCSEAAFTGKPLLIDLPDHATECYHRDIVRKLMQYGAARLLSEPFSYWSYTPPDPSGLVAAAINNKLHQLKVASQCVQQVSI